MSDKYKDRELVYVTPYTGATLKYGFQTNADEGVKSVLGHTAITGDYPEGLVIGANTPKPPRASRERATGVESSFISAPSIAAARQAGWRIRPGKVRPGANGRRSKCVYVTAGSIKYAWMMPLTLYARITAGDKAALGIQDATPNDLDLVFGASYPRIPKVNFKAFGQDGTDTLSTFCDPQKLDSLPSGWAPSRASRDRV